jgi:hypothetical protein
MLLISAANIEQRSGMERVGKSRLQVLVIKKRAKKKNF